MNVKYAKYDGKLFRVRNKIQESTEKKRKNALKKVTENRRVREVWYIQISVNLLLMNVFFTGFHAGNARNGDLGYWSYS